jgi:hypothetical protein
MQALYGQYPLFGRNHCNTDILKEYALMTTQFANALQAF